MSNEGPQSQSKSVLASPERPVVGLHRRLIQVAIVLVVFPASLTAISIIVGFPLDLIGRAFATKLGDWVGLLDLVNTVCAVALGLAGAIWVCRLAWPKPVCTSGR